MSFFIKAHTYLCYPYDIHQYEYARGCKQIWFPTALLISNTILRKLHIIERKLHQRTHFI